MFSEEDEKEDNDIQFGEQNVVVELINIATKIIPLNHEYLATSVHKINLRYYVDVAIHFYNHKLWNSNRHIKFGWEHRRNYNVEVEVGIDNFTNTTQRY